MDAESFKEYLSIVYQMKKMLYYKRYMKEFMNYVKTNMVTM